MLRDGELVFTEMGTQVGPDPKSSAPNIHMQATLERSSRLCSCMFSYNMCSNNKEKEHEFERERDDGETGESSEREMM